MKFLEWWSNLTSDMAVGSAFLLVAAMLTGIATVAIIASYTLTALELIVEIVP